MSFWSGKLEESNTSGLNSPGRVLKRSEVFYQKVNIFRDNNCYKRASDPFNVNRLEISLNKFKTLVKVLSLYPEE